MSVIRERHTVVTEFTGIRLQEYLPQTFELLPSRAGAKKAVKRGEVMIDGTRAETARIMRPGMIVELLEGKTTSSKIYRIDLPILYEDDYLALINKPAGIPVSGNQFKTIQNALPGIITLSNEPDALPVPRPVHRLDAMTSGILIIAKTAHTRRALGTLFEERKIQKTYRAIVIGKTEDSGEMTYPIEEKFCRSSYKKMSETPSLKSRFLTLLELTPQTGRTHQLRIHCAQAGFPIAGDLIHGDKAHTILHKGLFLTATKITFTHPMTKEEISVEIALPRKFSRYLEGEKRRYLQYIKQLIIF